MSEQSPITCSGPEATRTLWGIQSDLAELEELLSSASSAHDWDDPAVVGALERWRNQLQDELETKVDNLVGVIVMLAERGASRGAEAKRIENLARLDLESAERLRNYLKETLKAEGIKRVEGLRARVTVTRNGGKQPMEIDDGASIPDQFLRPRPPVPDKDAIREALGRGEELAWARLLPRGDSLRIK